MKPKIIFLDFDGVINNSANGTRWDRYEPQIDNCNIRPLNRIILETEAQIVISSTWRQYIHNGYMNEWGMYILLRSHGLTSSAKILGTTRASKFSECGPRSHQIRDWLKENEHGRFVILDDWWHAGEGFPDNFIQTNETTGLTELDADRAIEILGKAIDEQAEVA